MLSIRLRRAGSTKKPYFRVVVTEGRSARDGSFVENVSMQPAVEAGRSGDRQDASRPLAEARCEADTVRTLLAKHVSRDLSAVAETPAAQ